MQSTNRIENTTTFSEHRKPILLALEYIGGGEYAIRYSCKDSAMFYEIKDVIMSFSRDERRWDSDQMCAGKYGCWVVDETVLDELTRYFPSIPAWLAKTAQPTPGKLTAPANIEECPF